MAIRRVFTTAILALTIGSTPALAQQSDARIGIVRLQDALTGCREGKAARKKLQADFKGKQNQLKNRESALKRRYEQLEKQKAAGASDDKMRADLATFQKSVLEAQELRGKLQRDLAEKEAELTRKILLKMKPLIAKIARKDGYTVIIDANQVLHSPDDLDITDKLVRLYDKENP